MHAAAVAAVLARRAARSRRTAASGECETRLRAEGLPAKSIFQLVGNGQVGAGSVRGMPFLARLRAEGFAIWPFDAASARTVFEIYPTAMRAAMPDAASMSVRDEPRP